MQVNTAENILLNDWLHPFGQRPRVLVHQSGFKPSEFVKTSVEYKHNDTTFTIADSVHIYPSSLETFVERMDKPVEFTCSPTFIINKAFGSQNQQTISCIYKPKEFVRTTLDLGRWHTSDGWNTGFRNSVFAQFFKSPSSEKKLFALEFVKDATKGKDGR